MSTNIISRTRARSKQVFYGWYVVAASFLINAFGIGTFYYGFSTFFNPMIAEFGWSRTLMSGVFSLSRLEGGIEGPVAGWLIDRFGSRRILLFGISLAGIGWMLTRLVDSPQTLYLIFALALSLGYNFGYTHATTAAVTKWFIRKRGRALAFLVTGQGIGGAIFVPVIAWLIVQFDWRATVLIIGIATLLIPLPLSRIIKNTPEDVGLKPDGDTAGQDNADLQVVKGAAPSSLKTPENEINFTVREALKSRAFWILIIPLIMRACIASSIVVHQIPHLTDIGIPYQTASNVLGLMVLLSVPGRFIFGFLGDRYSKRLLLFICCLLQGIGVFIFINATTTALLYLFVVVYGLGYGGFLPLTWALRADLFGRKNYATIAGLLQSFTMIGTVTAPILAGFLFDTTHSYSLAFYVFLVLIVLAGILFLLVPKTSQPDPQLQ